MDLGLNDRVVVVTGGAKGIGEAIVRACAREGARPVIVDKDATAADALWRELKESGAEVEVIVLDLSAGLSVSSAIEDLAKRLGRIDGLVNNAGFNDGVGLEHGSPELFRKSLEANLAHYYTSAHAALPFLKASRGSIVNIGSKVAFTGQGGTSGYAAAKGAILGLTAAWAEEFAGYGIRVNAVIPAEVATPQYRTWLTRVQDPQGELAKINSRIPLGHRLTEPDEIAATVMLLLSSRCPVNGQHLFVDGGYVHLDRGA